MSVVTLFVASLKLAHGGVWATAEVGAKAMREAARIRLSFMWQRRTAKDEVARKYPTWNGN